MEALLMALIAYIIITLLGFAYVHQRLNAQDKYLSTYLRSFANYSDDELPPFLNSTEIKEEVVKKPESYSPRHDQETIMQGKVIDPFD
jgi:hypothetical protein